MKIPNFKVLVRKLADPDCAVVCAEAVVRAAGVHRRVHRVEEPGETVEPVHPPFEPRDVDLLHFVRKLWRTSGAYG